MSHDTATTNPDDSALKARQAELRAFVEDIADHVMSRQMPTGYLEAERGVRAVAVSDRFLQAVPAEASAAHPEPVLPPTVCSPEGSQPPPPHVGEYKNSDASPVRDPWRLRLRGYGDRVMDATTLLQKPDSFLEAERAQRYAWSANRMLIQLYAPPATRPTDGKSPSDRSGLRPKGLSQKRYQDQPDADQSDDGDYEKYVRMIIEHRDLKSDWEDAVAAGKNPPRLVLPYEDDPGLKEFWVQLWLKKMKPHQAAAERKAREAGKPWPPPHWSRPVETWFPNATPEDLDMFRPKPPPDTA